MLEAIAILKFIEGNKWAKRALLIVLLIGVALGVRAYYIHKGEAIGRVDQKQETAKSIEQDRQTDRATAVAQVNQANQQSAQAQVDAKAAADRADKALAAVQSLATQQAATLAHINALSDAQVRQLNLASLGRASGDATPGYTAPEERKIASTFSNLDNCEKRSTELDKAAQSSKAEADANQREASAEKARADAVTVYAINGDANYTKLWNLNPPKKRAWKCLKILKCGELRLDLPNPQDLKGPAQEKQ